MKIKVDKEKCIGCALCWNACPEVFAEGKDGKSYVKAQKDIECVEDAIEGCPVQAISE